MYYKVPDSLIIQSFCATSIIQTVYIYRQYWDVNICGSFSSTDQKIAQLQQQLLVVWRQKNLDIDSQCHCLYVDIFESLIQVYQNQLG